MPSLTTLAMVAAGGFVLYGAIRAGLAAVTRAGREAERAERARAQLKIERRQSAVIAEQRSVEDARQRLDSGSF